MLSVLILSAPAVHAVDSPTTLTFDDVSPVEYVLIQDGYHDMQWNNFFIQNGLNAPGFYNGAVSPPNMAFNGLGDPASISSGGAFTLQSAYFTAVYVDTQQIRAQGFLGGIQTYDNSYPVNNGGPTLLNFNYSGIDEVRFSISTSPRGIFAMDNLVVIVPEPSIWALFSVAVVAGVLGVRRPKAQRAE